MDPITTFQERRFTGRTQYSLYPSEIEATGKDYGACEYTQRFPLHQLDPIYDTVKAREKGFSIAVWIIAAIVIVVATDTSGIISLESSHLFAIGATLTLVSVLLFLGNFRKRTYAVFNTTAGTARIAISDDGTQSDDFQSFLNAIQQQIRKTQNEDNEQIVEPNTGRTQE